MARLSVTVSARRDLCYVTEISSTILTPRNVLHIMDLHSIPF